MNTVRQELTVVNLNFLEHCEVSRLHTSHGLNFQTDSMHLLAATRGLHHPQSQVTFRVREWEESRLHTAPLRLLKMSLRSALRMWQEGTRLVGWLVASSAGEPGRPASERELFTATFNTHSHVQLLPTTVSLVSKSCWRPRRCRKIFWYLKKKTKEKQAFCCEGSELAAESHVTLSPL